MKEPVVIDRWIGRMELLAWINNVANTQYGSVVGLSDCVGYASVLALVADDDTVALQAMREMRMDIRESTSGSGSSPTSLSTTRRDIGGGARVEREHVLRIENARVLVAALRRAGLHAACSTSNVDELAEQLGGGQWAAHNHLLQYLHALVRVNRKGIARVKDVLQLRIEAHALQQHLAAKRAASNRRRYRPRSMSSHLAPGAFGSIHSRQRGRPDYSLNQQEAPSTMAQAAVDGPALSGHRLVSDVHAASGESATCSAFNSEHDDGYLNLDDETSTIDAHTRNGFKLTALGETYESQETELPSPPFILDDNVDNANGGTLMENDERWRQGTRYGVDTKRNIPQDGACEDEKNDNVDESDGDGSSVSLRADSMDLQTSGVASDDEAYGAGYNQNGLAAAEACALLESDLYVKLKTLLRMQAELRVGRSERAFLHGKLDSVLQYCSKRDICGSGSARVDALTAEVTAIILQEADDGASINVMP